MPVEPGTSHVENIHRINDRFHWPTIDPAVDIYMQFVSIVISRHRISTHSFCRTGIGIRNEIDTQPYDCIFSLARCIISGPSNPETFF